MRGIWDVDLYKKYMYYKRESQKTCFLSFHSSRIKGLYIGDTSRCD